MKQLVFVATLMCLIVGLAAAQEFSFDVFVGTWEGQYTSESFGGSQFDMTLIVQPNGFYTDSSGHFMPPYYYPDTQNCEFNAATNRLHFWYLDTVYGGAHFYEHHYYEVVSYTGDTLELHYNFWDDPEPHPTAGTIVLHRAGVTAAEGQELPISAELSRNFPFPKMNLSC